MKSNNDFYQSKEWKKCRNKYIETRRAEDKGKCELCRRHDGYIVKHILFLDEFRTDDYQVSLNQNNLVYLCYTCNEKEKQKSKKMYVS